MERVAVDDVDGRIGPAAMVRGLTEPLGLTDLAMNYYELDPGDSFAYAYHNHEIQEEVFYVIEGTATFETESGDVDVGPDEAVRFGREEFQRGWNRGDERVVAIALGAPLSYGESVTLRYCPECEGETDNDLGRADDEAAVVAHCGRCGVETGRWYRGSMAGEVP
ncbi:cupin domain-containing protein [Halolamina sp. CBA1230]|uniref:cupin domain-containing protein n=1 Tax=Halolamina sp. CBA1230 TaxID=1853690 RepID=UPI0009A22BD0|nr:cupin domain-containing protein [Halolamina sp. CBA1230]QKY21361.1 cupin domain-containing protein [Halolamina sp. CBA1230]